MSNDIWALGELDDIEASAAGIAAGAELGQLVILQIEQGGGPVAVALADVPRTELFKMLVVAIATLGRPDVLAALAGETA